MVDETQKSIDSIQQLMRRLNVIVYHYINKDGKYRSFRMPAQEYIDASDMVERAREYEKIADEVEALDGVVDNDDVMSLEEFVEKWDAEVKE